MEANLNKNKTKYFKPSTHSSYVNGGHSPFQIALFRYTTDVSNILTSELLEVLNNSINSKLVSYAVTY